MVKKNPPTLALHSETILSDGANRVKDTTVVNYNADLQNQNKLNLYPPFFIGLQ